MPRRVRAAHLGADYVDVAADRFILLSQPVAAEGEDACRNWGKPWGCCCSPASTTAAMTTAEVAFPVWTSPIPGAGKAVMLRVVAVSPLPFGGGGLLFVKWCGGQWRSWWMVYQEREQGAGLGWR